jgi:hypothetical protein
MKPIVMKYSAVVGLKVNLIGVGTIIILANLLSLTDHNLESLYL